MYFIFWNTSEHRIRVFQKILRTLKFQRSNTYRSLQITEAAVYSMRISGHPYSTHENVKNNLEWASHDFSYSTYRSASTKIIRISIFFWVDRIKKQTNRYTQKFCMLSIAYLKPIYQISIIYIEPFLKYHDHKKCLH